KMFSDGLYGGKEGARRAARKFKRTILRRLPRRKFVGLGYRFTIRKAFSADTPSSTPKIPARNLPVAPRSSHQPPSELRICLSRFHTCQVRARQKPRLCIAR